MTADHAGLPLSDVLPEPPPGAPASIALVREAVSAWRLHWEADPLFPPVRPTGRYRFDAPAGEFPVLYANRDRLACFAEVYGDTGTIEAAQGSRHLSLISALRPLRVVALDDAVTRRRCGLDGRIGTAKQELPRLVSGSGRPSLQLASRRGAAQLRPLSGSLCPRARRVPSGGTSGLAPRGALRRGYVCPGGEGCLAFLSAAIASELPCTDAARDLTPSHAVSSAASLLSGRYCQSEHRRKEWAAAGEAARTFPYILSMQEPVRIGVIGAGGMGTSHAQGIRTLQRARVAAVSDSDEARGTKLAGEMGVPWFGDYQKMLREGAIDAVSIASPPFMHREMALAAAVAGKHVFCEKPMAVNVADCEAMIQAAEQAGVTLMVGQVLRFLQPFLKVRELVDSGAIGRPIAAEVTRVSGGDGAWSAPWRAHLEQSGGLLLEINAHEIDLLRCLGGDVASVYAEAVLTGTTPVVTGLDGLKVVEIARAAYTSASERRPVLLPER